MQQKEIIQKFTTIFSYTGGPSLFGSDSSAVFWLGRIFLGPNLRPPRKSRPDSYELGLPIVSKKIYAFHQRFLFHKFEQSLPRV